ncbi:MAG: hypothetical protein H6709_08390 [Kofleriaceae bacterium]|nr:hypothetical protein [Kofleriaceae bacterium]
MWPAAAGVAGLVAVKQLQAALDLTFWVVIAERLDARQARRLIPLLVAAQGVGAAVGAIAVVPVAQLGVIAVLIVAAALYAGATAAALGLEVRRRVGAAPPVARPWRGVGASWRGGLDAVRRSALARNLAVVVAIAGAFATLVFYTLGAAAAAEVGGDRQLAQFLGTVRGAVQALTLLAQLFVAPRLLARGGVAATLVVAPAVAAAFALGFELSGALVAAVLVQGQARLLDAAVQTPGREADAGAGAGRAARSRRRLRRRHRQARRRDRWRADRDGDGGAAARARRRHARGRGGVAGRGVAAAAAAAGAGGGGAGQPAAARRARRRRRPGRSADAGAARAPARRRCAGARCRDPGAADDRRAHRRARARWSRPRSARRRRRGQALIAAVLAVAERDRASAPALAARLADWAAATPDDPSAARAVRAAGLLATGAAPPALARPWRRGRTRWGGARGSRWPAPPAPATRSRR